MRPITDHDAPVTYKENIIGCKGPNEHVQRFWNMPYYFTSYIDKLRQLFQAIRYFEIVLV